MIKIQTKKGIDTTSFGISTKHIWILLSDGLFRNPSSFIFSTRLCTAWITIHRSISRNTVNSSHNATTGTIDQNHKSDYSSISSPGTIHKSQFIVKTGEFQSDTEVGHLYTKIVCGGDNFFGSKLLYPRITRY